MVAGESMARKKQFAGWMRQAQTCAVPGYALIIGLVLAVPCAQAGPSVWLGDDPELESTWTTEGNWYSGLQPLPGDSLVFGGGQKNNNNDFPPNTPFASITFTNDGWNLGGNAVRLINQGVAVNWSQAGAPLAANTLSLPVT